MAESVDEGSYVYTDVGQIIAGKYELVKLLGKGAMGEVWLATHNTLGGEFAIKVVEPTDDIEAETAAGRFQLEAQIAAKLSRRTRHIVSVSDHGEENGLAYLVMERLEGESLEARISRTGPLSLAEVAAIVSQVTRALAVAHDEGIFHRDLKPANIWLGSDEDGRLLVKLLDFGIARSKKPFRTRSPFATSKDMVLGTPSYMSPEQARGLDSLDYRCDLWALAVAAYEGLAGCIPFEGTTVEDVFLSICTFRVVPLRTYRTDLEPEVEEFFACAFAEQIDERFQNAADFNDSFEALVPPEELHAALGFPAAPISRPRFGSNPEIRTQPGLGPNWRTSREVARPGSNPEFAAGGAAQHPGPELQASPRPRPPSNPDLSNSGSGLAFNVERARNQQQGITELDDVTQPRADERSQRRSRAALMIVALVGIVAIGAGFFALLRYRADHEVSAARPIAPPPATVIEPREPMNVAPSAPTVAEPILPAPTASTQAPSPKVAAPVIHAKGPSPAKVSAPAHPTPGPQVAPAAPRAPASAPGPTKTVNKSEIL